MDTWTAVIGWPRRAFLSAIDRYFFEVRLRDYRFTESGETIAKGIALPQDLGNGTRSSIANWGALTLHPRSWEILPPCNAVTQGNSSKQVNLRPKDRTSLPGRARSCGRKTSLRHRH